MNAGQLKGLFINCIEAQDSIFESGKMVFGCLVNSDLYSLDYIEITPENRTVSSDYDFYFFNYHPVTMSWLETKSLKQTLPGVKFTMVLEVSPNDPFVYCSPEHFDGYCVLDPTLNIDVKNAYAFPRPLEVYDENIAYEPEDIPVIGSFGFATEGKGFEHVIDAVNREFDEAVVRINIPFATYADESRNYADRLAQMCRDKAKNGIEVVVTHDFMSKSELIKWCGENTLNCFLYDRNMPGLAATTDQAISSGRPLSISKNNTFRHIQKYIKPFPYQTLKEAIKNTPRNVEEIQREWAPENFRKRFEAVVNDFVFESRPKSGNTIELPVKAENDGKSFLSKIKSKVRHLAEIADLPGRFKNIKKQKNSYSQFGEDVIIADLLEELSIKNVSYLDIGANNPKYISNTYLFYEKGCKGVLVEPNRILCEKLKAARPRDTVLNFGIGTDDNIKEADFYQFPEKADGLSTFSREEARHWEEVGMGGVKFKVEKVLKLPLLGINHVISKYFTEFPDFVSIDVEGWDLKILKTLDFAKYSPAVFCVETLAYKSDGSTYRNREINEFFESVGYFAFEETYANTIFVNRNLYDFYLYQKNQKERNSANFAAD
ncbi:MAG TPA: FkbM family methyltransferase [Pyrinomonadaceae bacterium]